MKLFSYAEHDKVLPALYIEGKTFSLSSVCHSLLEYLEQYGNDFSVIEKALIKNNLTEIKKDKFSFAPPIYFPRKLLCVAGNYIDHLKEGGLDPEKQKELMRVPWLFTVPPSTVMIGHQQNVIYPKQGQKIDYEGELAVVIAKRVKEVSPKEALSCVAGYTIFNDVSERSPFMTASVEKTRDLSFWYKKSFDTFGPTGPFLTTKDEIPNPQDLTIRSYVNGEEKQNCHTSNMIFPVYELISFLSGFMTLEPGDIISTGTPSGVGAGMGGVFMQPNDIMKIKIDGLGELENQLKQH